MYDKLIFLFEKDEKKIIIYLYLCLIDKLIKNKNDFRIKRKVKLY